MSVKSNIFDEFYYSNVCFGSEEYKKSKGLKLNPKVEKIIDDLRLTRKMDVLEIACGRGDTSLYIAKKVKTVIGIDYSEDAIKIANNIKSLSKKKIKDKLTFLTMKANRLKFKTGSFNMIILIDALDHLNKNEVNQTFLEMLRVLKPGGTIFIKTCANKILLNKTYRYYILPLNKFLTTIDKVIKGTNYKSLPDSSRTVEAKIQHVNEVDYFYLNSLFRKYDLQGKIWGEVGFLTQNNGLRSKIYNFLVTLNPLSQYFPLNIFFAHSFFALMHKKT